jgi:hypothetical protein
MTNAQRDQAAARRLIYAATVCRLFVSQWVSFRGGVAFGKSSTPNDSLFKIQAPKSHKRRGFYYFIYQNQFWEYKY